jgi:virginiamycin B lyase
MARKHLSHLAAALVATAAIVAAAPMATASAHDCTTGCVTKLVPPQGGNPFGITSGPLGSIWFSNGHAVSRVDGQGQMTRYPVPDRHERFIGWMTHGTGGTVWFAERATGKVGVIDASGTIREYALPSPDAVPQGIVFAPDGNVYVTEQGSNAIARLNPTTGAATDIPVPTPDSTTQSGVLGPDGAIWFIERAAAKIGRMTLDGTFTEYPLTPGCFPNRIVVGPDGALWFTELFGGKVGRITTQGLLTEYPVAGGPVGITVGADGQLYVALAYSGGVARLNLQGTVTGTWSLPGAHLPLQIATGFHRDLWVSDNDIYHVTPYTTSG